ncbi:lectin like domain-containing protein [bacterium]|nr:lectin like domain-containing protein [bacterium]
MIIIRLLILVIWSFTTVAAFGAPTLSVKVNQQPRHSLAPMNPRFIEHINKHGSVSALNTAGLESGADTPGLGLVPEPFILPAPSRKVSILGELSSSLPTYYDLRTTGKLTSVKNQGSCGSCWAFAALGSIESYLMPGEIWDFSENNMKNNHGFDYTCCYGGNRVMAAAYLARWDGPLLETEDPYTTACISTSGFSPKKHVQDVIFLPDRTSSTDNDAIKNAIINYGAVYTTFYWSSSYYKSTTTSYYCSASIEPNHAVCIVGWNDYYPASNFLSTPGGDGAFLIKNSWGTSWGDVGYFWISYYDANMGKAYSSSVSNENAVFLAGSPDEYDTQYSYDTLGLVSMVGYGSNTAWAAMVFYADSDSVLRAAAWYALKDSTSYELRIYESPTSKPTSGTLVTSQTGTILAAGYHTIALNTPVLLTAGTKYSCVVKLTTPGYNYPIGFEYPYAGYSSAATANSGETYISSTGNTWTDMTSVTANASACLKAFASNPVIASVRNVKAIADGSYVRLDDVVVSAIYGDCIYVQDPTIPTGIRVDADGTSLSLGQSVTVVGTLGTYKPDGTHPAEREITSASVY